MTLNNFLTQIKLIKNKKMMIWFQLIVILDDPLVKFLWLVLKNAVFYLLFLFLFFTMIWSSHTFQTFFNNWFHWFLFRWIVLFNLIPCIQSNWTTKIQCKNINLSKKDKRSPWTQNTSSNLHSFHFHTFIFQIIPLIFFYLSRVLPRTGRLLHNLG